MFIAVLPNTALVSPGLHCTTTNTTESPPEAKAVVLATLVFVRHISQKKSDISKSSALKTDCQKGQQT
jgi:hypothetical protein